MPKVHRLGHRNKANKAVEIRNKKEAYLQYLEMSGAKTKSAKLTGIASSQVKRWIEADPLFEAHYETALSLYSESLELEADRRATEGWEEPIFWQGKECGHRQRYSDSLLAFRLRGLKPEMYREDKTGRTAASEVGQVVNIYLPDNNRDEPSIVIEQNPKLNKG